MERESLETLATVLAVTRVKARLPQPERVQELLAAGDPGEVLDSISQRTLFDDPVLERARRDVEEWTGRGMGVVSVLSEAYPARLRDVREAPALLYYEGSLAAGDQGVCVVGSRDADDAALRVASHVSTALVEAGLTVVSGLATGIDAAAHAAALKAAGRTVAVMGTGLERTYPRANARLRADIVESGGLVMTQFEPGAAVRRANFPMRNAIMSGYGITTFVVTAGEHSGTRIQAVKAVEHGRGVILARRVAQTTSWGREMARTGRALVADGTDDILAQVHDLQAERARAEDLLRELTA
ncbi:DNA-processing protein DprA [Actinomyces sp. oral taxon 414]|uniref:DNA-processing protein DprA n=1 Tax=Actinomyces sp. oral taxon 414 TaxID=712122 RepID=UPI001C11CBD7|nr:DNA-processing protein DprA [Actinomyces sp. oral taxon 414]